MDDEYWKKPDPLDEGVKHTDPGVGVWSRSFGFRAIVWLITMLAVVVLALVVSAYLSGFNSMFEMISWIRTSVQP